MSIVIYCANDSHEFTGHNSECTQQNLEAAGHDIEFFGEADTLEQAVEFCEANGVGCYPIDEKDSASYTAVIRVVNGAEAIVIRS